MSRYLGVLLAVLVVLTAPAGIVSADHSTEKPDSVTVTCDKELLNEHRPWLDTRDLDVKPLALHGFVANSPNEDTTMLVYSVEYTHQSGVREFTSHSGDHEWIYIELDQRGDVRATYYSAFHWLKATDYAQNVNNGHPRFDVAPRYHHHISDTGTSKPDGAYSKQGDIPLKCLNETLPDWLDNGMEDDLGQGTVYNPWTMTSRGDWWSHDTWQTRGYLLSKIYYKIGWHDADLSDVDL